MTPKKERKKCAGVKRPKPGQIQLGTQDKEVETTLKIRSSL
jgi:hypothetical protein